jgi:hypothetical protein
MAITVHDQTFVLHTSGGEDVAFEASNQDTTDATYQYFGYISSGGSWIVQRFHIIGSVIIYEYYAGQDRTDYDALWNAVTGVYEGALVFTTFDQITVI